jgi:hypothetical protein
MNVSCSLRGWCVCSAIISCVSLLAFVVLGEPSGGKGRKRDAKTPVEMVDAIVNHNQPPKLVERASGSPRKVALFLESYDWEEDNRVRRALDQLYQDTTAELWEELVRRDKEKDGGYCVTMVSVKNEDAEILSVSRILGPLVYSRLVDVFEQHLPRDPNREERRISLPYGIEDLSEWRKARKDKALYLLQIELCETALTELAKVKGISKDDKKVARKKIEAEIEKLRSTKRPVFMEHTGFFVPFRECLYTPDLAKRVREAVKSGSSEAIEFIK